MLPQLRVHPATVNLRGYFLADDVVPAKEIKAAVIDRPLLRDINYVIISGSNHYTTSHYKPSTITWRMIARYLVNGP